MSNKGYVKLKNLRNGAIFITKDGICAVKSEYRYSNENLECECVLLESGEYAHFAHGNDEMVCEIPFPFWGSYYWGIAVGMMRSVTLSDVDKQKLDDLVKKMIDSYKIK